MLDLGPHASFIIAAYGVTAIAVTVLTISTLLDDRSQRQKLAALERQGIRRRSAASSASAATTQSSKPKISPSMTAPLSPSDQATADLEETKKPAVKRKAPAKRKTPAKAKSNARNRPS